jgi:hypothetical protein
MADLPPLKLVEVLGVGLAGGLFVWWQLRDVAQAQKQSAQRRAEKAPGSQTPPDPDQKESV